MNRSRRRNRLSVAAASAALILTVSACSSADSGEDLSPAAAPITTTQTVTTEAPQEPEAEPADPPATTPPAATTTEAPAVTTTAAPEPAPTVTIWSAPRLHDTSLSASWQVTPDDSTCNWDLLNEAGEVIVSGVADTADGDPSRRGMAADYDPASPDALGAVTIRCSRADGEQAVVEQPVHRVTYKNRSPDSVIPATDEYYFDHDEVAALFPDCSPGRRPNTRDGEPIHMIGKVADVDGSGRVDYNDWLQAGLDFWEQVFENWDTEVHDIDGHEVVSGWWTTEQLRMQFPDSSVTAASALQEAFYNERANYVWPISLDREPVEHARNGDWRLSPSRIDDQHYYLEHLYLRLNDARGYEAGHDVPGGGWRATGVPRVTVADLARMISDTGLPGTGPNPPSVRPGNLLWDWTDARYRYAPIDREPAAWAMRTLLETRSYACVARQMREHCDSGEFHASPHMRHPSQGGSRLGSVLWSAVCPDITP